MNTKRTLITLTILLLTASWSFAGGPPCSAKSVAGDWGLTTTGVIILPTGPVPVAAVGRFTADAAGNTRGGQDRSLGGQFAHETFNGHGVINSDCTAKYIVYVYDSSGNLNRTSVLDAVFTNGSSAVHVIFESITLPDGTNLPSVLTFDGNKLSPKD